MQNVKIRLEGTPEKIEEALKRIRYVFSVSKESGIYQSREDASKYLCYLTVYMYVDGQREINNLHDINEVLRQQIQDLQEYSGSLAVENQRLKEQLELVPKPKPWDAVLGTPHTKKHE